MRKPSKFAKKDDANNEARKKMLKFFQVGFSKLLAEHPLTKWVVEKNNATKDEKNACTVFLYIEDIKKKMFTLERFLEGLRAKLQDLTQMMENLTKTKTQKLDMLESRIKDLIKRAGTFQTVDAIVEELKQLVKPQETKGNRGYSIRVLGDAPAQQPKMPTEGRPDIVVAPKVPGGEMGRSPKSGRTGKPSIAANLFATLMGIEKPAPPAQVDSKKISEQTEPKSISVPQPNTLEEIAPISQKAGLDNMIHNQNMQQSQELEKYKPLFELEPMSPDAHNRLSAGTLTIEKGPEDKSLSGHINDGDAGLDELEKHDETISSIHSPELGVPGPSTRKRFMLTTETDREPSKKQPKLKHSYSSGRQVTAFNSSKAVALKPKQPDSKPKLKAKLVSAHLHLKNNNKEKSRSRDPLQRQQRHNLFQSTAPKIESSPYNESPKVADQIRMLSRYSSQESQTPKRAASPDSKKVSQLKKILTRKVIEPKPVATQKLHSNTEKINISQTQEIRVKKPSARGIERLVFPNILSQPQPSPADGNETKTPKKQHLSTENREGFSPVSLVDRPVPRSHLAAEEQNTLHLLPRRASRTSTMKAEVGPLRSSGNLIENPHNEDRADASFEVPNGSDSCSSSSRETEKLERKQTLNRRTSALTNNRGPRSMTYIAPSSDQQQNHN